MNVGANHIGDEMLAKYIAGEATEREQAEVQQWIAESDANNKHYYHLKLLWEESRALAVASTVDENAAWARFKQRTAPRGRKVAMPSAFRWVKIAAVLLVLAGGSWLGYYMTNQETEQVARKVNAPVNVQFPAKQSVADEPQTEVKMAMETPVKAVQTVNAGTPTKTIASVQRPRFMKQEFKEPLHNNSYHRTLEYCNATPCPLEICITQTVRCPGGEPLATSTCSVLEPDESGQLRYKAFDKITKNCKATIDQITIRQVTSGETIVLNAHSKPATAEEFFNYITGQKKGDIVAGIFKDGCTEQTDDCGLTFDSNYGRLIMQ